MTAAEAVSYLKTDAESGLSELEVARRMPKQNNSGIWHIRQMALIRCAVRVFSDVSAILLLLTALIAAVLQADVAFWAIFLILLFATAFRTVVYVRSRREFFEAARRVFPRVRVLRGGKVRRVGVDRVVLGDIILLSSGDLVPCDIRLIREENLLVDESAIGFGETVRKRTEPLRGEVLPEKRVNTLLAATTVKEGDCVGVAVATGKQTYVCMRHGGVSISAGEKIPQLDYVERFCRILSFAALAMVVFITIGGILFGGEDVSAASVFLSALAFCTAASGEFLSAAGYLSVALAMKRSGETRVRIKEPFSVSRIGGADCFVIASPSLIKSGRTKICAWYSEGEFSEYNMDRKSDELDEHGLSELLELAYITTGDVPESVAPLPDGSTADYEMIRHLHREYSRPEKVRLSAGRFVAAHMPGDVAAAAGLDTALLRVGGDYRAVVSGAPESILRICDTYRTRSGERVLTDEVEKQILSQMGYLRHRASSIVAVAARVAPVTTLSRPSALRNHMCFIGYFAVTEFLSEETVSFLSECRGENISFVLLSEGAETDRWFAAEAGLFTRRDLYLTKDVSPAALENLRAGQCAVVCIDPADGAARRKAVLDALRESGRHVVFIDESTGDATAASSADAVFAAMPYTPQAMALPQPLSAIADAIVSRGSRAGVVSDCVQASGICRAFMLNLRHAAMYLLTSNAAKAVILLLGAFVPSMPLLSPVTLLLWGLILDVFAALAIIYTVPPRYVYLLRPTRYELPGLTREVLHPLFSGVLFGCLSMLGPVVAGALGGRGLLSGEPAVWVSVCFGSMALAVECMQDESMFLSDSRFSRTLGILAGLSLFGAVLVLLPSEAALLVGGLRPDWLTGLLALMPVVLTVAATEIYKKMNKNTHE